MLLMNPHAHRCCQHDFGHGWPYFAKHAWLATSDRGAAALLFTAGRVTVTVADGARVTIEEETRYPFEEEVAFTVRTETPVRFPLYLRVPGWCGAARVALGEEPLDVEPEPGRFVRIERSWEDGDVVRLALPMEVSLRRWRENRGTVSVDRGPLTFSLQIGEEYVRAGGTDAWPAWEIHPTTPWNYALELSAAEPSEDFTVERRSWPADDRPWTHASAPIRLRAKARRVPEWGLDDTGLVHEVQESPVRTAEPVEEIVLLPMGAARLRISAFPVAGDGDDAHVWEAPPEPLYRASASHCFGGDTPTAMADGREPASSDDHSLPRHTFWDHRGTTEWIQAEFDEAREVSRVALYWFDDEPRGGGCRVPVSWRLLHRDGERWLPVAGAGGYGVERDRFNETEFGPVTTGALRVEVQLRDGFSAGVLEWRVD